MLEWLITSLVDWLVSWSFYLLVGWLVGGLVHRLVGQLIWFGLVVWIKDWLGG